MAKAGYGKRHAPDQAPPHARDFRHLAAREAAIGAYIDRLPEGAAIGYKTLAEELPDYGQQACRSALDRLTREGHLRRIKVHLTGSSGSMQWVTRTYFSRTARNAAWWAQFVRFVRGIDVTGQPPAPAVVSGPVGSDGGAVGAGATDTGAPSARVPGAAPWHEARPAGAEPPADRLTGDRLAAVRRSAAQPSTDQPSTDQPSTDALTADQLTADPGVAGAGGAVARSQVSPVEVASVVASIGDLMAGRMDAPPPGSAAARSLEAAAPVPEPGARAPRSEAYDLLAALGDRDPRLQLSADECGELEPLAGEWLVRGLGRDRTTHVLTSGLPPVVHSAGAFLRQRLEKKMPPAQQSGPNGPIAPNAPHTGREEVAGALMMCLFCDEDETTTTLLDGVCAECRADIDRDEAGGATGDVPDTFLARPRQRLDVAARVAELRAAAGRPGTVPVPRRR
ncbi:hypothetical protein OG233_14435 [Streptomyces sp. NBC_01218]|uniref:hypothetical protein n=1 Tax=unclassified Streptomyces TaxID=2593676 RepID=UPI002E118476|nr:hypothetical protein OG233_14435 [Streptomyces sp. NBC_01218]